MTLTEFLISSFLSLTTAFGIYYIIANVKERKWTNLILITLILVIIVALLIYPTSSKVLEKTTIDKIGSPLLIFLLIAFLIFLLLSYFNKPLKYLKRFKSHFVSINNSDIAKKINLWKYYHFEKEKSNLKDSENRTLEIKDKYFINHKYLYQLIMPCGYKPNDLTDINQYEKLTIGIVHMIHQEDYISWIDVIYWRILNYFSCNNFSVHVFISEVVASNEIFLKYLKQFLGNKVIIEDSLFKSLKNINEKLDPNLNDRLSKRQPNYNKLRYFSQLSPIFLSKKHIFILLWEGYYTQFKFYEIVKKGNTNLIELKSENIGFPISINLSNYKTEFLVAPTCFAINDDGEKYGINPRDTFLLGQNIYPDVLKKINDLNNYSLRSISSQVLCSTLPWIERILFKSILNLLIIMRQDRQEGENNTQIWSTKAIAKVFVFMTDFIHNRIVKNA